MTKEFPVSKETMDALCDELEEHHVKKLVVKEVAYGKYTFEYEDKA